MIVAVLNHDAIPILLPEVCPPNTLVSFAETIADHIQYADYALATSARVARDLCAVGERFLGRSMSTRVIKLGADFAAPSSGAGDDEPGATPFPELSGLRYLLSVGTIDPRKNHALLLQAFDRLSAKDAGLVIVGRKGWMADEITKATGCRWSRRCRKDASPRRKNTAWPAAISGKEPASEATVTHPCDSASTTGSP